MKKKIALGLIALVAVVGGVAGMSAFEAHVINVTAHIENALSVNTEPIDFGTVFPQEYLEETFVVELSSSFLAEDRADDVNYVIKQKPKPIWPEPAECNQIFNDISAARTYCHDNPGDLACCYLSLCPFLSKMDGDPEDNNDTNHRSYFQGTSCLTEADPDATGRLSKLENDLLDIWTVDLKVPPVEGFVGQDWPAGCPTVPEDSKNYGCDLWIEVTDISEAPERPTVGADLSSYVQPTGEDCDVTVGAAQTYTTIQAGVDAATSGQTVCVEDGEYTEDVTIGKTLTLAGAGASATSVINGSATIQADDVVLEGFEINGPVSVWGYDNVSVLYNKVLTDNSSNAIVYSHSGSQTVGGTIMHNEVSAIAKLGIYLDHDNVIDFTVTYNTVAARKAIGFGSGSGGAAEKNSVSSTEADVEVFDADQVTVNTNNLSGMVIDADGSSDVLNAENNWWGDNDPSDQVTGDVDYDPYESSAYPEN